jgi:hypothetical protein
MLRYAVAWLGLAVLGVLNGSVRVLTYGKFMPDLAAHQLSTATGILLVGYAVTLLHRRWPIHSSGQAIAIGFMWLCMTVIFEFGFGHYLMGHSWTRLLHDYNLFQGRVWSLFLAWLLLAPWWVYWRATPVKRA